MDARFALLRHFYLIFFYVKFSLSLGVLQHTSCIHRWLVQTLVFYKHLWHFCVWYMRNFTFFGKYLCNFWRYNVLDLNCYKILAIFLVILVYLLIYTLFFDYQTKFIKLLTPLTFVGFFACIYSFHIVWEVYISVLCNCISALLCVSKA